MSVELLYQLLPFIIMILVGLLIALLWLLWVSARQERASKDELTPPDGPELTSAVADEPAEGAARTTLPPPPDAGASASGALRVVEAMRILRDGDGTLVVDVDGRRYRSLAEVADPAVRSRVLRDAQALAAFARLHEASPPPAPPPRAGDAAPREPAGEPPSEPGHTPDIPLPPVPGGTAPPPLGSLSRSTTDDLLEEVDNRPFVDQIEELLQYRRTLAPEFAGRSIHIRPAPDGGVRILVDGQTYETVDEVEETGVRQFLQDTIREWEARQ